MLDSGAGRSLIRSDIFKKIQHTAKSFFTEVPVELYDINDRRLASKGVVTLEFTVLGDKLLQEFIVVDAITEDCVLGLDALYEHRFVLDGRERTIYRIKEPGQGNPHLPIFVTGSKVAIMPFSAQVVDTTHLVRSLPTELSFSFCRAPELPLGLRVDPFISESEKGTVIHLVIVNRTDKTITLPKLQVLGCVETKEKISVKIASCSTNKKPDCLEDFSENLPPDLRGEDLERMLAFLNSHLDMFASNASQLGSTGLVKHVIDTQGEGPIRLRAYRASAKQKSIATKIINELLETNIIRPSISPWAAPIVLVKKKGGGDRLCVDYRKLNNVTKKDSFPLPRIDDVLDLLHGQKYFTTLDLASGYWQIEMDEASKEKTAFIVENNLYEWNRLAFGLTNAPGTFQRLMNHVLRSVIGSKCLVYLDDIIVFSKTRAEHVENLRMIFDLLRQANLKLGLAKCKFFCESVNYLGHIISGEGISPDPEKIEKLAKYPLPNTVVELQSFLGLASYYRRFIKQFSTLAHPLIAQSKKSKGVPLNWGPDERLAFESLRQCLITPPILAFPDFSKEFQIFTDASNYGIGAVLSQMQDNKEVVIAYASRHLNTAEVKYSTIEREALAVVFGIKRYRYYLLDEPFVIVSDHRPLQWLESHKDENSRLGRWAILLAGIKYKIRYRPGRVHENADFLSRIPVSAVEPRLAEFKIAMKEQEKDTMCHEITEYLKNGTISNQKIKENPIWVKEIELYCMKGGLLCRKFLPSSKKRRQFIQIQTVVPYSLRKCVVQTYHDSPLAGHLAYKRTYLRIRDKFYWPNMRLEIEKYCKACETCAKQRRTPTRTFLHPLEITNAPFEVLGMDFLGPIQPNSLQGNNFVLVITDYFTKWVEVIALPNQTAQTTCRALMERIVHYHGPPKVIITDRGTNFTSKLFEHLCRALNIEHRTTTAYHPQSNGLTERFNKTVVEMIRKYISDGYENWEEILGVVASAYRNSVHSSTLETPYFLNHGRDPTMVIDRFLIPQSTTSLTPRDYKSQAMKRLQEGFVLARNNLIDARKKQKIQYDKRAKELPYDVGDKVLLDVRVIVPGTSKKLNPIYQGPYRVMKVNTNGTVVIRSYDGARIQTVHINRLKQLLETMIWRDEECVDFDDLRLKKPTSEPIPKPAEDPEWITDNESDQPIVLTPREPCKTRPNSKKIPPLTVKKPERRIGLRPWSVLRKTLPYP